MSKTAANNDAALSAAPEQGGRSIMRLVALFVIAFILATVFQINAHHDSAMRNILGAQRSTAGLIAERVNTNIAAAVGASAGAVELARSGGGADAMSLARAASLVPPAVAAAVVNRGRDMEAITDSSQTALVMAALAAASQSNVWTGAPNTGELPSAPTIVRRIGDRAVVTVLDPAGLLPDLEASARVLIAAPSGQVIFASPALRDAGLRTQQQLLAATQRNPNAGAMLSDSNGRSWSAAEAIAPLGEFRVIVAAPAPTPLSLWLEALFRFAILAAAPMAAVGVLYILQRQNLQRALLAEAEAERAETHSKITADGAKIGLLEWRPDVDEVQLSEQGMRLLGAMGDTLGLREFLDLIVTEDRFTVDEEFRRARQSGLLDARFRVTRGGNVAWIETRGTGHGNASGSEPRLFCSVVDVTQRYEAEARVSRLERQLRAAIESFSGPFALWDSRRRLLLWNQSFARTFDLGPELLRPRASYEAIAAASTARIRREKHDTSDPDVRVVELTSGDWLHIVERRAADGGVITVGVDITPLKRKEEELARNERRLQDALGRAETQEYRIKQLAREAHEERLKAEDASRAKSAFLANMSHELRTPLNAVIGFSEIMAKELFGPLQNDQYKQYSHDIYDSGNHLLDLINDILDMAKIEAGKLTLSPRPLDPSVAIEQAVRLTKRKAEEKSLSIVVDAENLPEIEADHRAVKQMLLNLLSNAVKFTDSGAIMVHARPNAEGLTLRVVDTGCGIPPEHLPRLAQPFQQVETELTRNNHGTGLGLALTKSLAEMHGGKLTIQSEVGRGTIVTITLPRQFGGGQTAEATAAE